jgi:STE24 endopeptidase
MSFTLVFLLFLAVATGLQLWLAVRHMTHVALHRDAVPAEFAPSIALDNHQKAADYTLAKAKLGIVELFVGVVVLLALTLGGGLEMASQWASSWTSSATSPIWRDVALIAIVVVATSVIDLPFSLYRTFVLEARFGFNRITPKLFVADMLRGLALAVALGGPLLLLVLWLMQAAGTLWWLYAWVAWIVFVLFVQFIAPVAIMPLFNKFTPMAEGELKATIEALMRRCGFAAKGLFTMDGSKRSAHGNAFFTGFGATKRVALFDTLVERLTHAEIEAVLAHELGHFKLKHVPKMMAVMLLSSFAFMALLGWLAHEPWFFHDLGVSTPSNGMLLVLLSLVLPTFTFVLHPLSSFFSRKHEFEADAFAAQHADKRNLVSALVKLYRDNAATLTPDPLHSAFYDSHPPASIRIKHLQALA